MSEDVMVRLQRLYDKLNEDGRYVDANTVALAMDEIKRLTVLAPPTH